MSLMARNAENGFTNSRTNSMTKCALLICLLWATGLFTTPFACSGAAIHDAIKTGNFSQVVYLLETYPEMIEQRDKEGFTPLFTTCFYNNPNCLSYLLLKGAHTNTKNKFGN